jgi:hypothetical protein
MNINFKKSRLFILLAAFLLIPTSQSFADTSNITVNGTATVPEAVAMNCGSGIGSAITVAFGTGSRSGGNITFGNQTASCSVTGNTTQATISWLDNGTGASTSGNMVLDDGASHTMTAVFTFNAASFPNSVNLGSSYTLSGSISGITVTQAAGSYTGSAVLTATNI